MTDWGKRFVFWVLFSVLMGMIIFINVACGGKDGRSNKGTSVRGGGVTSCYYRVTYVFRDHCRWVNVACPYYCPVAVTNNGSYAMWTCNALIGDCL